MASPPRPRNQQTSARLEAAALRIVRPAGSYVDLPASIAGPRPLSCPKSASFRDFSLEPSRIVW